MLAIDPKTTALVLIDLQNGILAMPLAPHSAADIVERAGAMIRAAAAAGVTIVRVRVAFSAGAVDKLNQPVDVMLPAPAGGYPAGWAEPPAALADLPADVSITKRQWSAFHGTELDLQLRRRGIDTVLIGGVATNFGVESTARDGWQHGYAMIVVEDLCSSVSADMHGFAIDKVLPRVAHVRSMAEVLAGLQAG